jgi:hypothetical protein
VPKDRGGASDPYLQIELGSQVVRDVDRHLTKTLKPDFYRMFELRTQLPGAPALVAASVVVLTAGTQARRRSR